METENSPSEKLDIGKHLNISDDIQDRLSKSSKKSKSDLKTKSDQKSIGVKKEPESVSEKLDIEQNTPILVLKKSKSDQKYMSDQKFRTKQLLCCDVAAQKSAVL